MKLSRKLFPIVSILAVVFGQSLVCANEAAPFVSSIDMGNITLMNAMDLINWKVGDSADYSVAMGMFGNGTETKAVTKEEGAAVWMHVEIKIMGQNQTVDALINRADAKILKYIVNGKEETPPSDKPEIISQDYTSVTVPAGTFKAIHIVAKTSQSPKMELWLNPKDTVMDGSLKTIAETSMGITMTLELTSFKRAP